MNSVSDTSGDLNRQNQLKLVHQVVELVDQLVDLPVGDGYLVLELLLLGLGVGARPGYRQAQPGGLRQVLSFEIHESPQGL